MVAGQRPSILIDFWCNASFLVLNFALRRMDLTIRQSRRGRRGLALASGGMTKILALLLFTLAACASLVLETPAPTERAMIIGTWIGEDSQQVFEADGIYCARTSEGEELGRWVFESDGYISLTVTSLNGEIVRRPVYEELRVVRSSHRDKLLMGYECTHCQDNILGSWYRRAKLQSECGIHSGTKVPPNQSFKPKPLRGST